MLRAGRGDRAACEVLVARHLGRIVAFAQRTLHDRSAAEDAAQDVFLRVWTAAPRWQPGAARFTTWLYRVAMNVCLDRLARKREVGYADPPEHADPRPGPSVEAQDRQLSEHVAAALAQLPDAQRIALTLCHYQGLRNVEAADVMDLSVEALESLLARGRRKLKEHLRDIGPALMGRNG